jgi:hypothetical protein
MFARNLAIVNMEATQDFRMNYWDWDLQMMFTNF